MGMSVAMVLDAVPAADDVSDDIRICRGTPANTEEAGFRAVSIEQIEHAWCDIRIRAIVEGECDEAILPAGSGQRHQIGAEQPIAWPHDESAQKEVVAQHRGEQPRPPLRTGEQGKYDEYMHQDRKTNDACWCPLSRLGMPGSRARFRQVRRPTHSILLISQIAKLNCICEPIQGSGDSFLDRAQTAGPPLAPRWRQPRAPGWSEAIG